MHKQLHQKKLAHVGKLSIAAEGAYHAFEIAGMHSGVLIAASVLLVMLGVKVFAGMPLH